MFFLCGASVFFIAALIAAQIYPKKAGPLSWYALVPIFYIFFFLFVPMIEQVAGVNDYVNNDFILKVYLILAAGMMCFWLGAWISYVMTAGIDWRLTEKKPLVYLYKKDFVLMVFACAVFSLIFAVISGNFGLIGSSGVESEKSEFGHVFTTISSLVSVVLLVSWWQRERFADDNFWSSLAWVSLAVLLTVALLSNSKKALITPILLIALVKYSFGWRPKLYHFVAFSFFVIFVIFPYVYLSRTLVLADATGMDRAEYYRFLINFFVSGNWFDLNQGEIFVTEALKSLGRGLLSIFTIIVSETGHSVPYMNGETYIQAFAVSVPRFIYPEKPDLNIGNFIGHYYAFINPSDDLTNISPSQPGELYMNFGVTAVFVGMALWGFIATIFYRLFGAVNWMNPNLALMVLWQEGFLINLLAWTRSFLFLVIILFSINFVLKFFRTIFQMQKS